MFRAAVLLSLAAVLLAALALISCLSVEDKRQISLLPRFLWVPIILLVPVLGPVGWFVFGRPQPEQPRTFVAPWRRHVPVAHKPPRPRAPDDDPEFLRSLERRLRSRDEQMLRRWEEDFRRGDDGRADQGRD
ncbi:MAG TPA: PLD nuclease N-terminal domain-containing protein [Natronosporangium sp.]|nr:PLD nuclease N-terminal domain-containing protein [Natronosporangium sp.]